MIDQYDERAKAGGSAGPDADSELAERVRIRESLANPPLLNILWFPLIMLIGIPLLFLGVAKISQWTGLGGGAVLAGLALLAGFLAMRKGRNPRLLMEEKRAHEATLDRPALARFLARAEPWLMILTGIVYGTSLLGRLLGDSEVGMGGMVFLLGAWYVGGVLGMTLALVQSMHIQDRYGLRLLIDVGVLALLLAKATAFFSRVL